MSHRDHKHYYVLIMAGGSGTRLFPRSTDTLPKQFQKIMGEKTLIEQAYERAKTLVDDKHIFISSNHRYVPLIKKYLPKVPKANYITEPVKRNTGPAIALATALIYKKDPNAIVVSVHSDHLVVKTQEYTEAILAGIDTIHKNPKHILCIGINPTFPHTGFGYIERSGKFTVENGHEVFSAKKFVEKPNLALAKKYLATGKFFWNAGYFIWGAKHFLSELKSLEPAIYRGVKKVAEAYPVKSYESILDREFVKFKEIAVDNMIMEKVKNLLVLPASIGWSDVGSWDVVSDMVDHKLRDQFGNYTEGAVVSVDTYNTSVFSHTHERVIATVGLSNLIIVTTEEAIVIVPKGRSEEVKKVVDRLKEIRKEQ